eukprot:gnl/MRDRNA2_/MRDRNA2_57655_c0_seq1.p1 gnl/MRDRNA2_/MRDRNA2_57655_c0~~gnl/MRDRNA2_/MRDRNA2_57655_c0_seq1.p1  ORF type:complete len:176 (-),score=28.69 gnl/MRDRNA2_/MRDRNA2_57655_c0_seq1:122-649(-)
MCGEKVLALLKGVSFYSGGMLYKAYTVDHLKIEFGAKGLAAWVGLVLHSIVCVFVGIYLEKSQNSAVAKKCCGSADTATGTRAYYLKFRQDVISSYMRMNSWIMSGLFNNAITQYLDPTSKLIWFPLAIVAQLVSLLLEQFRIRRLQTFVEHYQAEAIDDVEEGEEEAEEDVGLG